MAKDQPSSRVFLVVSDNGNVRDELQFGFPQDVKVEFATDAREAWKRLGELTPSAVIVDLQTGNAGGYGLTRDMQADARLRSVAVVMLIDRVQDTWLARGAGADVIMMKPISAAQVLTRLTAASAP